jgi:hypothetical protein
MRDKTKLIVIGTVSPSAIARVLEAMDKANEFIVVEADRTEEIQKQTEELKDQLKLIKPPPLSEVSEYKAFDDPKNYINGKKLPRKKKRK